MQPTRQACLVSPALLFVLIFVINAGCGSYRHSKRFATSKAQAPPPTERTLFPEPGSWSFPDVVESARKVAPRNIEGREFNQFGLAYSLSELDALPMATMSAEELQKYADVVTHAYPDAVFRQIANDCANTDVERLNSTAVAGLAYVSLHALEPANRRGAAECLADIQRKLRSKSSSTVIDGGVPG